MIGLRGPQRSGRRLASAALLLALPGCMATGSLARVSPGSLLLVASASSSPDSGQLSWHRPGTGRIDGSCVAAPVPTALTVTRDGERAVVSGPGIDELEVINLFTELRHARIELPASPVAAAMLDRRTSALVTAGRQVLRVQLYTGSEPEIVLGGLRSPSGLAWSPDLERAHVVAGSSELISFDLEGEILGRTPLPAGARHILRHPASGQLWIPCPDAGEVAVVDEQTLEIRSARLGGTPVSLSFAGTSDAAVVSDASSTRLRRIHMESLEVLDSIELGPLADEADPTPGVVRVEPAGRYAFAALPHAGLVAVVDLEAGGVTGVIQTRGTPTAIAWTRLRRRMGRAGDPGWRD